jgi:NhaD family Na+/H+ antiporter
MSHLPARLRRSTGAGVPLVASILTAGLSLLPGAGLAAGNADTLDLTSHWAGYLGIAIFTIAYLLVMAEEFTHLRKSKPVILAAGLMWAIVAWVYQANGIPAAAEHAVRHNLLEYAELMLFLLVAMTYVNAMQELNVFEALRTRLVAGGFSFRSLFWITGGLAFVISPVADNLTTALLMCAVVLAVGGNHPKFVLPACINIVVAANAGGAFSPFGDITTLMVWQKGIVEFSGFFALFIPALVNFMVPAALMHFAVPDEKPQGHGESVCMDRGGLRIILLFLLTIVTAVLFHSVLNLPPVIGMLTGMGYLGLFGYYLKKTPGRVPGRPHCGEIGDVVAFDVFRPVARAEWDTLFFFYGVVACVGALGFMGYLAMASELMYTQMGPTNANVAVGIMSAIVDNIPVMFAVLSMQPDMATGQWLLVTLTAGVGGSLLSIGSAAGVALMGQARGAYTFFGHLKWTWAIALGYAASITVHFWINAHLF